MTVQSALARIETSNATSSSRTFTATAATQDTPAGSSVVITVTSATGGLAPAVAPDSLLLKMVNTAGTALIKTFTFTAGHPGIGGSATSQTFTFFFTANGDSGGGNRAGTVEMVLEAVKNTGAPTNQYDVQSDGSNAANSAAAVPATAETLTLIRGWIRGTTTATVATSNVSLGGAKPNPYAYTTPAAGDGGDSIFHRVSLGAQTYETWSATHTVSGATPALSQASAAAASQTFDSTFTRVVDNRFPASSSAQTATATCPNATLNNTSPNTGGGTTGAPYVGLTVTDDALTVDPRITRTPLFQLDDNSFGTPPLSKDVASHRRQQSQQGFLASRTTNARGEGVNGVTYTVTLTPDLPGSPVTQSGLVTTTQGGQTGWAPSFLGWPSSLPGGVWRKTATYTAPADITGSTYVVQAAGTSTEYVLVARSFDQEVRVNVNHESANAGKHFEAGLPITVVAYMLDLATQKRIAGSRISSVSCSLTRSNPSDSSGLSNTYQFFNGTAWVNWTSGLAQTTFALTASPIDADTFEVRFADTTSFGLRDFRANVQIVVDFVTYVDTLVVVNLGTLNRHDTADTPPALATLTDVTLSSPTNSQSLTYDTALGKWKNTTPTSTLAALTDVLIAGPTDGQVLTYEVSNSKWENAPAGTGPQGIPGPTGAAGRSITAGSGAPSSTPPAGDLYVNTVNGDLYQRGASSWTVIGNLRGPTGADGREVEFRLGATHIEWRYVGSGVWSNLVALTAITGPQGPAGPTGGSFAITPGAVVND